MMELTEEEWAEANAARLYRIAWSDAILEDHRRTMDAWLKTVIDNHTFVPSPTGQGGTWWPNPGWVWPKRESIVQRH